MRNIELATMITLQIITLGLWIMVALYLCYKSLLKEVRISKQNAKRSKNDA